jgi:hypothetical protein
MGAMCQFQLMSGEPAPIVLSEGVRQKPPHPLSRVAAKSQFSEQIGRLKPARQWRAVIP